MAHFDQDKHINTLTVSVLRSQQVPVELQNSINITYGILDNIFLILKAENVLVKQIIPCLVINRKKAKMIWTTLSKKPIMSLEKLKLI